MLIMMYPNIIEWQNLSNLPSKRFKCGYCGTDIASDIGYVASLNMSDSGRSIYICHVCNKPTYFGYNG